MDFRRLTDALLAVPARQRVLALQCLLPAVKDALADIEPRGSRDHHVRTTAELIERWAGGEALDRNEVAHAVQLTMFGIDRLFESHNVEGGGEIALVLEAVRVVQVALVEALEWDLFSVMTMPVSDPLSDPPEEASSYLDADALELPDEPFAAHWGMLESPPHPAIERALAGLARRLGV